MAERAVDPQPPKALAAAALTGRNDATSPAAPTAQLTASEQVYPDKLDAGLLRIAGVCVLAMVMAILDTTVVSVAQRTFIAEFDSTQAVVAWTLTAYTLALATVIPLAGWAADRFGTKRLFMGSVFAFTVASLLCALAPNITLLIVFRAVQGIGGGMLMPLSLTILTRGSGPKRLGRLMAVMGIPMLLGPAAGPILGGWLIDSYGWEWIFRINLPIGLIAFVLAAIVFEKDHPATSEKFDVVGMLLLSPGLASFLYGVSSIPGRGTATDRHVWIPAAIGLALITGFAYHAVYRADHPLIDLRLFKNRVVAVSNSAMFLYAAAFFGAGLLFPSYFQQLLHQTTLQSGVHLIPQRLGEMLTMPIAGVLMDRHGPRKIVLVGATLLTAGMATIAFGVAKQTHYLPTLLSGLVLLGMGVGCAMVTLYASAVQCLTPHQVARGSTLINVNLQIAGSIGVALMSVILTNQFNRSENISAADKIAVLRKDAFDSGMPFDPSSVPQRARMPDFTNSLLHDLSHGYAVVFAAATILVALIYIPAAFLPKKSAGAVLDLEPILAP